MVRRGGIAPVHVSQAVRDRLVLVIGNLICRSIDEARKVPYILDQEEAVQILVNNPDLFARLVRDEHLDRTEYSSEKLTAKLDTLKELGQFEVLDTCDMSFTGAMTSDADLSPILEHINRLTRTFMVYVGNTITILEKEFELFLGKFRHSLQRMNTNFREIRLTQEDMAQLRRRPESYLAAGHFLQAFAFVRLLNSDVVTKEALIILPSGSSFSEDLIASARKNPELYNNLVKFILRVSYVSQGSWHELFDTLVDLVNRQPELYNRESLLNLIEQDGIFTCNLLRESFGNLRSFTPAERRRTIASCLTRGAGKPGFPKPV
jgi:hypothetical protein